MPLKTGVAALICTPCREAVEQLLRKRVPSAVTMPFLKELAGRRYAALTGQSDAGHTVTDNVHTGGGT